MLGSIATVTFSFIKVTINTVKEEKIDDNDEVITEIVKKLEAKYEINQLDGIKIIIDENTWSLIRKSNTEDIIRISTESNDKELLTKIQEEMIKMVKNCYEKIR